MSEFSVSGQERTRIIRLTVEVTTRSSQDDLARWRRKVGAGLAIAGFDVGDVVLRRCVYPPDMETMRAELADGTSWSLCVPVAADWDTWHASQEDAPPRPTPDQVELSQIVLRAISSAT